MNPATALCRILPQNESDPEPTVFSCKIRLHRIYESSLKKESEMKALNAIFGASVLGIVVCLIMTIYTGVSESRSKAAYQNSPQRIIPIPALGQ